MTVISYYWKILRALQQSFLIQNFSISFNVLFILEILSFLFGLDRTPFLASPQFLEMISILDIIFKGPQYGEGQKSTPHQNFPTHFNMLKNFHVRFITNKKQCLENCSFPQYPGFHQKNSRYFFAQQIFTLWYITFGNWYCRLKGGLGFGDFVMGFGALCSNFPEAW